MFMSLNKYRLLEINNHVYSIEHVFHFVILLTDVNDLQIG